MPRSVISMAWTLSLNFVLVLWMASTSSESLLPPNEPSPTDTSDVIMQEDAAEIFYNVDIQKYNDLGVHCPAAVAPSSGYLEGGGDRVGTVLYVRCRSGYFLHGPTVMACMPRGDSDAHWSPDVQRICTAYDEDKHERDDKEGAWEDSAQPLLDPLTLKGGVNPPFLGPGSQYWETRQKLLEQEQDEALPNIEEVETLPPICQVQPKAGPCRAAFRRFYFDPVTMECKRFIYGGCRGNENNFRTVAECNDACMGLN